MPSAATIRLYLCRVGVVFFFVVAVAAAVYSFRAMRRTAQSARLDSSARR